MYLSRDQAKRRAGFTLIELLIVIALIGTLAALVASATLRIVGTQEGKTTETNIQKLHSLLDQHWKAVIAKANSDPVIPANAIEMASDQLGNPTPQDSRVIRRARAIHVKLSLLQQFPVRMIELKAPLANYPIPTVFAEALKPTTKFDNPIEEMSSALLYLALKQVRNGVSMDSDTILNSMDLQPVYRIDGSVIPEMKIIVDSWGKPLVFSRWPTLDAELNPLGPALAPPWRDPEDPTGVLSDPLWVKNFPPPPVSTYSNFAQRVHETGVQRSFKLTPVIMSYGPDKEHGLDTSVGSQSPANGSKYFASLKVINPELANDNIYSYRLRLGGSGN